MNSWNPVLNLVVKIKNTYYNEFGDYGTYRFEDWLTKLDRDEFNSVFECLQINQHDNYILIRYGLAEMQRGMWEDANSIYRECRSIVIDIKNEKLVLTPFRKFFNLNEVEENMVDKVADKIKKANLVEVSNKLDGSMQNARWYDDKVFMCGSMAISKDSSWRLEDGYSMLTKNHINMIASNPEYTFTFEYISLKDSHVVIYDKKDEGLYLIGIRNTETGEQQSYSDVRVCAACYGVEAVEMEDVTLDEMLLGMKTYQSHEKEGWILNIDGYLIKLKCDDYVNIHRILDQVSSVNVVIRALADNQYDDLISKIPERYRERTIKMANMIMDSIKERMDRINHFYKIAPKDDRKTFMVYVNENVSKDIAPYVREKYLGREFSLLKSKSGEMISYKRLNDLGLEEEYDKLFGKNEVIA